jgi:Ras-related protein Rab-7L1
MAASPTVGQDKVYKILMVGRAAVGKTCILRRYCLDFFNDQIVPTLGCDFVLKTLPNYECTGTDVKLQIWDIAGQDYAPHVSHVFFRGAFGAVIACDITSERSYEVAAQWKRDIDAKVFFPGTPKNIPCVLMLNKSDLGPSHMTEAQLDAFCQENKFIGWFAVSAKSGENLTPAFDRLLKGIRKMDQERASQPQMQAAKPEQPTKVEMSRPKEQPKKEEKKCPC